MARLATNWEQHDMAVDPNVPLQHGLGNVLGWRETVRDFFVTNAPIDSDGYVARAGG